MQVKVQPIPKKKNDIDVLALFCFYYQQYKYHEAKKLPYKRIVEMIKVAQKEEARRFYQLTQIVSAPHTKKGQGVKKLLDYFSSQFN